MENRTLVKKLTLCSIHQTEWGFEVQFNLERKGEIVHPKDEDFGVWAWSWRTLERAEITAKEIESGKRVIVQMAAQV